MNRKLPEAVVQRVVRARLQAMAPEVFHDRINVMVASRGSAKIRSAKNGTADLLCCARGRFIAVELKSDRGTQSEDQRDYELDVVAAGGVYIIGRDPDQVLAEFRAAMGATP